MKVFVTGADRRHRHPARPPARGPRPRRRRHDPLAGPQRDTVRALGARPVVADALDRRTRCGRAVADAAPEVVVHQADRARAAS